MFLPRRYPSVRTIYRNDPTLLMCYPLINHSPMDISGKGNHGSLQNTSVGIGKRGRESGVWCPGTAENRLQTPQVTTLQEFTCGGWAYCFPKASGGEHSFWNKKQGNASAWSMFPFTTRLSQSATSFSFQLDSGNDYSVDHQLSWTGPLAERWFFYCATRKNPNNAIFIDGECVGTSSWSGTLSAASGIYYRVGAVTEYGGGVGSYRLYGFFGEHFFFNRRLGASEIMHIYRATAGRYRNAMLLPLAAPTAPAAPTGLSVARGDRKNTLSWAWSG